MDESLQMVRTKGSELAKKDHDFLAVVFRTRGKTESAAKDERKAHPNTGPDFDIKNATKEIIKLGAKGFYQRRRDRTLKSLAVELGANPEKTRFHNYTNLKDIRKKNRERREEHIKTLMESHNMSKINYYKKKSKKRDSKVKSKSDVKILNKYGKRR